MNPRQSIRQAETKFDQTLKHFQEELRKIHTGRAHPSMLDGVMVEAYGTEMPILQVGSISVPEPQLLQITPFDVSNLSAIAAAIRNNKSIDMNPMDDGKVIRLPVPPLTEERRKEYVKLVNNKAEDAKVSLRNARHEARNSIDQAQKDKTIGEDDAKMLKETLDKTLHDTQDQIDNLIKAKQEEIMTV